MNNNRHAAVAEKKQEILRQKNEAGSLADRFPEVASIMMSMTYNQKGTRSILRTFHFAPTSYAFFVVNCLRQDCIDGGFDLTPVITAMIKDRRVDAKGTLNCGGADSAGSHSDIAYEVAIQYV